MTANPALIAMSDITKVFYTDEVETHALSGVHFNLHRGEYVSISGPSGCGKSTLLSILGLLDSPTGGKYTLNGTPVENLNVPTCVTGSLRELVEVPVATDAAGREMLESDCEATPPEPTDDIGAFTFGFASLSDITPAA